MTAREEHLRVREELREARNRAGDEFRTWSQCSACVNGKTYCPRHRETLARLQGAQAALRLHIRRSLGARP